MPLYGEYRQLTANSRPNPNLFHFYTNTTGNQAQSEYKHSLTFRVRCCCHSNETRAPVANPPNSSQLEGTPTVPHVTCGSVQ